MLFAGHDFLASFSGALSMVSNMGPTYLPPGAIAQLPAIIKLTYITGMLAGRLEILPVLLILSPRAWR
jgi:trk system potassium uptake protein TrkH